MAMTTTMTPQTFTYKTVVGLAIQADVYRRPSASGGAAPAILWIHGGALIMGERSPLPEHELNLYLDAGYAVVSIDYRLAPETKLAEIVGDVIDAYDWLVAHGAPSLGIDAGRIAAMGHSAGGYLALMLGCRRRVRGVVSFYGYGDLLGAWYTQPDPYYNASQPAISREEAYAHIGDRPIAGTDLNRKFYRYCRQQGTWTREISGHDPADPKQRAMIEPFCPVLHVTPDYPPTLLLHGDLDTDVPYAQSVMMAYALLRHGVRHELHTVPAGPHGFDSLISPTTAVAFERVMEFLGSTLDAR